MYLLYVLGCARPGFSDVSSSDEWLETNTIRILSYALIFFNHLLFPGVELCIKIFKLVFCFQLLLMPQQKSTKIRAKQTKISNQIRQVPQINLSILVYVLSTL